MRMPGKRSATPRKSRTPSGPASLNALPNAVSEENFRYLCRCIRLRGTQQAELKSLIDVVVADVVADRELSRKTPSYNKDRRRLIKAAGAITKVSKTLEECGPCAEFGFRRVRGEPGLEVIWGLLRTVEQAIGRAVVEMKVLPEARGGPDVNLARRNALSKLRNFYTGGLGRRLTLSASSDFLSFCQSVFEAIGLDDFVTGLEDAIRDVLSDPLAKRLGETPRKKTRG